MSYIRPVLSPQGGFGGLSPPNWNMKTINEWSFVNFFNVKASTRKQKTHSNHNAGWFSPELTLSIIWGDFHPELTLTITSDDFHLGTAWPPLLPGYKSPEVSMPSLQKTWKWSMHTSAPHRWQLARQPCFVLFWWWTGSTAFSYLKVHVLNEMLWPFTASARTTRASPFWFSQSSRNFNSEQKSTRFTILDKIHWPFTTSAHNKVHALSGSNCFPLKVNASLIPLPVSQWKPRAEQEQFAPNRSASSVLALVWPTPVLASVKLCWRGLLVNLHAPTLFAQIGQGYFRRDLCVGILLHLL